MEINRLTISLIYTSKERELLNIRFSLTFPTAPYYACAYLLPFLKKKLTHCSFFCHLDAKPLTKYQFTYLLHKSVKFISLDTTTFKSHSFRIGGSTHLYLQNYSEEDIKSKGRQKSNAFNSYIRLRSIILCMITITSYNNPILSFQVWIIGSSKIKYTSLHAVQQFGNPHLDLQNHNI